MRKIVFVAAVVCLLTASMLPAQVCNIKVITDASPDYSDMDSMVRSITAKWPTMQEKCWSMWYWVHIARRQTAPQVMHGSELGDPIRMFNDYGYSMCSTMAGVNNAIWNQMGMKVRFRDIHLHTVSECYYDNRWHIYDNSLSALYTLCDGKTIAGVDDVGIPGACELSGGKVEPGHIAKYHCLTATSDNGFLTGSDGARSLESEYKCFAPPGLQYYWHWCGWETGHRYILNLREGEAYTRYYRRFDKDVGPDGKRLADPESTKYYVPTYSPKRGQPGEPRDAERGFTNIRANGLWVFKPSLAGDQYEKLIWAESDIGAVGGIFGDVLEPAKAGAPASVTFRIHSANVTTSMTISAALVRKSADDSAAISISTDNGMHWTEVYKADATGDVNAKVDLLKEVNGAYEILIRFDLLAKSAPADAALKGLEVRTITQVNSKTQPRLNIGKNVVYVDAGEATDSIVYWPDDSNEAYKLFICDEKNIGQGPSNAYYYGSLHPEDRNQDAYVTYRVDAPGEITRVIIGGRYSNRYKGNHIDLLWSVDEGKTWTQAWSLTSIEKPYDTLHQEPVAIPPGHKTVWVKYFMTKGASVRSTHVEADFKPADAAFKPIEVTFAWNERQADRSPVRRSHTQLVDKTPCRYEINVGGQDHPFMESLQVNLKGSAAVEATQPLAASKPKPAKYGYSDGKDNADATKFVHQWQTVGKNFAQGKPVKTTPPSDKWMNAAGADSGKLTDGVVGGNFAGGPAPILGEVWNMPANPVDIDVDLGKAEKCGAFRIHLSSGWPWPESLIAGNWKDTVELLTSADGKEWASQGFFKLNLWYKDIPINYILPDNEKLEGYNYELALPKPVECRHVRWRLTAPKHAVLVTEVQALDFIKYEPFDIRLTMPDEKVEPAKIDPSTLTPPAIDLGEMKSWPGQPSRPTTAKSPAGTDPATRPSTATKSAAPPGNPPPTEVFFRWISVDKTRMPSKINDGSAVIAAFKGYGVCVFLVVVLVRPWRLLALAAGGACPKKPRMLVQRRSYILSRTVPRGVSIFLACAS